MSWRDPYCHAEAFIEQDQINWMCDGVLWQLVTVLMVDDTGEVAPAGCAPRSAAAAGSRIRAGGLR